MPAPTGPTCCVAMCPNSHFGPHGGGGQQRSAVTYFTFPSDPIMRLHWMQAILEPSFAHVCSRHFLDAYLVPPDPLDTDLSVRGTLWTLRKDALPLLNLPTSPPAQPAEDITSAFEFREHSLSEDSSSTVPSQRNERNKFVSCNTAQSGMTDVQPEDRKLLMSRPQGLTENQKSQAASDMSPPTTSTPMKEIGKQKEKFKGNYCHKKAPVINEASSSEYPTLSLEEVNNAAQGGGEEMGSALRLLLSDENPQALHSQQCSSDQLTFPKKEADSHSDNVCGYSSNDDPGADWMIESEISLVMCDSCGTEFASMENLSAHVSLVHSGPFVCEHCGKVFATEQTLNAHVHSACPLRKHYNCDTCGKTFTAKTSIEAHQRLHTGEKPYMCDACGYAFVTRTQLKTHQRHHTGERPFVCETCGKSFGCKGTLKIHNRVHTGEKNYKCEICYKSYRNSGALALHRKKHTGENPYKCDFCSKTFASNSAYHSHRKTHTEESPFKCTSCGKSFRSKDRLKQHIHTHTGDLPYDCEGCGKKYSNRAALAAHKKVHTEETTPHKCDTCGKSFSTGQSLRIHQRTHTGEKPCKCPECGRMFRTLAHVSAHMTTHTGEQPHKCDTCGKRFSKKVNLRTHERVHTGEKPFECDTCGKQFTTKSNLGKHKKLHM